MKTKLTGEKHINVWEFRREHYKDYVDCMCEHNGLTKPKHKEGCVTRPKNISRSFNGKKFWPLFKKLGHTSCNFDECSCVKTE